VARTATPVFVNGPDNGYPGSAGTITSKASAGSPPYAPGSLSGPITWWKSQNVHGQPCVSTSGSAFGDGLRAWT
jgi:hypothetical protein